MKDFFKSKIATVLILAATLILAGIAVFTAYRLYQLRQEQVAPSAPTSKPQAATVPSACTALAFNISGPSQAPSASPSAPASQAPSAAPSASSAPSASATARPKLPVSGTSFPTIIGAGVGILLIVGSALLAF